MADRKDSKRQRSEDKTGRLEAEDRSRVRWFYLIALTALVVSISMALIWARSDFIDRFEMVAVRDERIDDSMRNEVISIVTKQKLFLGAVGFLLATTVVGFVPWLGGRPMGSRVIRDILFPRKVDRSLHDRYIRAKDRPTGKWLMVVVASITLSECGIIIWLLVNYDHLFESPILLYAILAPPLAVGAVYVPFEATILIRFPQRLPLRTYRLSPHFPDQPRGCVVIR